MTMPTYGNNARPVRLDPWQNVVEVGWPSGVPDYFILPFSFVVGARVQDLDPYICTPDVVRGPESRSSQAMVHVSYGYDPTVDVYGTPSTTSTDDYSFLPASGGTSDDEGGVDYSAGSGVTRNASEITGLPTGVAQAAVPTNSFWIVYGQHWVVGDATDHPAMIEVPYTSDIDSGGARRFKDVTAATFRIVAVTLDPASYECNVGDPADLGKPGFGIYSIALTDDDHNLNTDVDPVTLNWGSIASYPVDTTITFGDMSFEHDDKTWRCVGIGESARASLDNSPLVYLLFAPDIPSA